MNPDTLHNTGPPHTPEERDPVKVARLLERLALGFSASGIPRMAARAFAAILIADDGRRTAAELAAMLNAGAPAISGAVKHLTESRMVIREREPGQRRDHYRVDDDMWAELLTRRSEWLLTWQENARDGMAIMGPSTPAGRRLRETHEFLEFIRGELPKLLHRWAEHQADLRKAEAS
ncbi:putative transcriptional regulator [Actinoalloteichus hoggarensis]|uniref:Uncharacterized protein n=1 Tax=Actinoalloteichus hoggarensis TaxID=1470176 RepID=A0A221W2E2_9PSEU|nr:helix-turn-helix domain-containing protein [Actinoalloteichus hoggarensis]ASO19952.1 hypothetical protein AHOG_11545 [Actinoalloteichus hoggarensis]MBB5919338.1 putative transcriptional regulator [Actinoalloteichus hoggarensis]